MNKEQQYKEAIETFITDYDEWAKDLTSLNPEFRKIYNALAKAIEPPPRDEFTKVSLTKGLTAMGNHSDAEIKDIVDQVFPPFVPKKGQVSMFRAFMDSCWVPDVFVDMLTGGASFDDGLRYEGENGHWEYCRPLTDEEIKGHD